jgi:MFS family permease
LLNKLLLVVASRLVAPMLRRLPPSSVVRPKPNKRWWCWVSNRLWANAVVEPGVTPGRARRPPLYYGWLVVGALAITEPISWGILFYGFGVMLTPIQQELGWSQAELTGAFSLMLLVSGLTAVPVGRWLDRHGARGLMTLGSCLAVLAIIAWAQVQTLVGFYGVWLAIGVINAMSLYEPAFTVTATWFVRRRAQALTLLTLGGGLASVIFVPLAT